MSACSWRVYHIVDLMSKVSGEIKRVNDKATYR